MLEENKRLTAEMGPNDPIMMSLWKNAMITFTLKVKMERLQAQLPISVKSMREPDARIDAP